MPEDTEAMKGAAVAAIELATATVEGLAREIYENPELSGSEERASAACIGVLRESGFEIAAVEGVPTAFVATIDGAAPGPVVGLLAEYDALPEVRHACGHHLIAGSAVGAGIGLAAVRDGFAGQIKVFGCPAEETLTGKRAMLDAGAFEGVDLALTFHANDATSVMSRSTGSRELRFAFSGTSSHAATEPWVGTSALDGVLLTMQNVNALRQFVRDGVRISGIVTDGGAAHNVIPAEASCTYGIRSADPDELERVVERVIACAEAGALASATALEITRGAGADPVRRAPDLAALVKANLDALGEQVDDWETAASTDFGDVSQVIPAVLFSVATWPDGTAFHTHEAAAQADEPAAYAAMTQGARAMAMTAIDVLSGAAAPPRTFEVTR